MSFALEKIKKEYKIFCTSNPISKLKYQFFAQKTASAY